MRRTGQRVLILAGFIVVATAAALVALVLTSAAPDSRPTTTVDLSPRQVVIPAGASADKIASLLEAEGVIPSAKAFLTEVRARGVETALKPGTYEFVRGEPLESILNKLTKGLQSGAGKVTIPEGLSIDQVAARLDQVEGLEGEEYAKLARDPTRFEVPAVGGSVPQITDLEGLLFPSTYYLPAERRMEGLIAAQLEAFASQTADLPWEKAKTLGLSPYQIVIVASMIEKETAIPEERALVAAVIYNRIKKDMRLDIDATVRFALKKWTGDLTKSDLEVDSPYNTRKKKGLPPGPISSPGVASLRAALEPATVDYLYYVLTPDNGKHFFTASYEEFLEASKNMPSQE